MLLVKNREGKGAVATYGANNAVRAREGGLRVGIGAKEPQKRKDGTRIDVGRRDRVSRSARSPGILVEDLPQITYHPPGGSPSLTGSGSARIPKANAKSKPQHLSPLQQASSGMTQPSLDLPSRARSPFPPPSIRPVQRSPSPRTRPDIDTNALPRRVETLRCSCISNSHKGCEFRKRTRALDSNARPKGQTFSFIIPRSRAGRRRQKTSPDGRSLMCRYVTEWLIG